MSYEKNISDRRSKAAAVAVALPGAQRGLRRRARATRSPGLMDKRLIDLVAAAILRGILSPLLAAITVAIRLDSPGPILLRQQRHGKDPTVFGILKFRTMTVEASASGKFAQAKAAGAACVTRVGKFLRRTSLNELPQLLNVLRGEMSLVGPRPHAVAHDAMLRPIHPRYDARYRVTPGVTGLAQVKGLREETKNARDMRRRVAADICYADNWHLMLDLKILLLTPWAIFAGRNAH